MDDEPTPVLCTAICHTDGCPLNGEARQIWCYANAAPPIYRAWCAQCSEPITDITPVAPAAG